MLTLRFESTEFAEKWKLCWFVFTFGTWCWFLIALTLKPIVPNATAKCVLSAYSSCLFIGCCMFSGISHMAFISTRRGRTYINHFIILIQYTWCMSYNTDKIFTCEEYQNYRNHIHADSKKTSRNIVSIENPYILSQTHHFQTWIGERTVETAAMLQYVQLMTVETHKTSPCPISGWKLFACHSKRGWRQFGVDELVSSHQFQFFVLLFILSWTPFVYKFQFPSNSLFWNDSPVRRKMCSENMPRTWISLDIWWNDSFKSYSFSPCLDPNEA